MPFHLVCHLVFFRVLFVFGLFFFPGQLLFTTAVLLDQLVKGLNVPEYMNTPSSVQVGRFKEPQVVGIKVAERHCKLLVRPFFKIERLKLSDLAGAH